MRDAWTHGRMDALTARRRDGETARWRVIVMLLAACAACGGRRSEPPISDSAYAKVQERGHHVMGVDQYEAQHVFETLPDGGRIVLAWPDTAEVAAAEIATIRTHMREIAQAFTQGDFSAPFLVHSTEVPGTAVMRVRREAISYAVLDRPGGAEVRIRTSDPIAMAAVTEFLAFQRNEHRAPGHAH